MTGKLPKYISQSRWFMTMIIYMLWVYKVLLQKLLQSSRRKEKSVMAKYLKSESELFMFIKDCTGQIEIVVSCSCKTFSHLMELNGFIYLVFTYNLVESISCQKCHNCQCHTNICAACWTQDVYNEILLGDLSEESINVDKKGSPLFVVVPKRILEDVQERKFQLGDKKSRRQRKIFGFWSWIGPWGNFEFI